MMKPSAKNHDARNQSILLPKCLAASELHWQNRSRRDQMVDGCFWFLSAAAVLLLISGVAALALQAPPPEIAQDTAPPALIVELSPPEQACPICRKTYRRFNLWRQSLQSW
jgi:hypothetical protein